jgi:hypothetical protein
MTQLIIIIGTIFLVGIIAGLFNLLFSNLKIKNKSKNNVIKCIVTGIGVAIFVPIFLNILSESVNNEFLTYNKVNTFVFSGICFVTGYITSSLMNIMGVKLLNSLIRKNLKNATIALNEIENNQEYLNTVEFENEYENENDNDKPTPIIVSDNSQHQIKKEDNTMNVRVEKIIESFSEKKIRTAGEIAVEINSSSIVVSTMLEVLYDKGILKKMTCLNGNVHWALTQLGTSIMKKENEYQH